MTTTAHPLDPLSADEFTQARAILAREHGFGPGWRIASIELREPAKDVVREFSPGDDIVREARVVLWDTRDGAAYKALLSLTDDARAVAGSRSRATSPTPPSTSSTTATRRCASTPT